MIDMVKVTCYGSTEIMDRDKAKELYLEGMMCSDGSERERYTKIYLELCEGLSEVSDEE